MKKFFALLWIVALTAFVTDAQVVTTDPSPVQESTTNLVITFHADQGNKGLMGYNGKIYAHTGVITNKSTGTTDWQYTSTWGDNNPKYEMTYLSANTWALRIGNIREFYGITDPSVIVEQLAFVFRNADGSKEGKTAQGGDIFVPVVKSGLQVVLTSNLEGNIITSSSANVTFNITVTQTSDLSLKINDEEIASASDITTLNQTYLFTQHGDYTVTATATNGDNIATSTLNLCYVGTSQQVAYPGVEAGTAPPMGPVANSDGTVTFCLGAPEKDNVVIVGAWNNYAVTTQQQMRYTTDANGYRYFWWTTTEALDPDTMYPYYFIVDGEIQVGDPYARLVLDPANDKWIATDVFPGLPSYPIEYVQNVPLAIYWGNINSYNWQVTDFKGVEPENLIIYELLFRDFTGTEGKANGNGTVQQAIEKIPYLRSLNVNAIELLPIMEFNGNNSWGYNTNFYFAPDKAYGTPDDYKEFIDLCHQNGMAVILDIVLNQSDGWHPWFQMYNPATAKYNGMFYNLTAPHAYSVLNDWNQGNPLVQQQWADAITYWLTEYNVDGFRFDLVKGLGNNDSYANNGEAATNAYNASRVERMRQLQKVVDSVKPGAYFINENLAGAQEENQMAETGQLNWANVNEAGCQFAMGYSSDSNLNRMYAINDNRTWGSTVSYLESHDEQRLAYKQEQWGANGVIGNVETSMQRLGSAAAQMLLAPGAHMIWQFSEMGNAQNTKNSDGGNNTDPKIVNWHLLAEPNHKALYDTYRSLAAIRATSPELFAQQGATFTEACNSNNWSTGRYLYSATTDKSKELYTVINPNTTGTIMMNGVPFAVQDNNHYYIVAQSYNSTPTFNVVAGTITVPANCFVCVGTTNVSELEEIKADVVSSTLRAHNNSGMLTIDYAEAPVDIYAIDGKHAGRLDHGESMPLHHGIYMLVSGNESLKIIVK